MQDNDVKPDLRMLWIDLETTGLDPEFDVPLEIGLTLTDQWGDIGPTFKTLVFEDDAHWHAAEQRGRALPIVNDMHTKNNLWSDLDEFDVATCAEAEEAICHWLQAQQVEFGKLPMCGSSIGSLDRPFVQTYFPNLNKAFSYRNIDISSVKEICRRVNPELAARIREEEEKRSGRDNKAHRVLEDIEASIFEYTLYVENFFFVTD